jgi:hypothetical protein
MRNFNSFILSNLKSNNLKTYSLFDFDLENTPAKFASTPYPITFNGSNYVTDIGVIDFKVPIQSASVDRQSFSVAISDNLSILKNSVSKSNAGRDATIYMGFFNTDGTPNTNPENVLIVYKGFIDKTSYSNDFDEAVFIIELSSPMADLSLVNTMITSADGMDQYNLTDTSFDKVIEDNEEIVKWGKI